LEEVMVDVDEAGNGNVGACVDAWWPLADRLNLTVSRINESTAKLPPFRICGEERCDDSDQKKSGSV
jgi:hypothetical protein